ncbi:MAG: hypothetical protein CMJ83_17190 [Planctomycetes bacterium]|nr:hypothetical protein [Planctomycetota bacterium]
MGRLLAYARHEPAWNMAVDEAVLRHGTVPTLRLYGWSPPGISLGRFQPGRMDIGALADAGLPLVRRMTGGGAIVHWHEVTYSMTVALDDPRLDGCDTEESYAVIHAPIREALQALGVATTGRGDGGHGRDGPVLCFDRATPLDLVVAGRKLVGSAQRRVAGRVLQHGSIVLSTNPLQPGTAALDDLLSRTVPADEVARGVAECFDLAFGPLAKGDLTPVERSFAEKMAPSYRFS